MRKFCDLSGRIAIVTGGASGIGRAIAFKLASLGATVVLGDVKLEELKNVVNEITQQTSSKVLPLYVNVS